MEKGTMKYIPDYVNYLMVNRNAIRKLWINNAVILAVFVDKRRASKILDDWFSFKMTDIVIDSGLTDHIIRKCVKQLESDGYLTSKRVGLPSTKVYSLNCHNVNNILFE